ncbi:Thioesterase domain-containing protein [Rhodotorula kratochvilovae]
MTPPSRLAQLQHHLAAPPTPSPPPAPHQQQQRAASSSARPQPPAASEFRFFLPMQTRWNDNDQYGHMNNAVYSFYFDSITNYYLQHHALPPSDPPLGLIVSSNTTYASSLAYPQPVIAALAVSKLTARSVVWRVALFGGEYAAPSSAGVGDALSGHTLADLSGGEGAGRKVRLARGADGQDARAAAWGEMVHVFVDPETRRPVKQLGERMRGALQRLVVEPAAGEKER